MSSRCFKPFDCVSGDGSDRARLHPQPQPLELGEVAVTVAEGGGHPRALRDRHPPHHQESERPGTYFTTRTDGKKRNVLFDDSFNTGARCSSVVRAFAHGAMVRWVVGSILHGGARCSSVVRAFAHGAMGRRIDPSWWSEM